jgi:hypothetical protein
MPTPVGVIKITPPKKVAVSHPVQTAPIVIPGFNIKPVMVQPTVQPITLEDYNQKKATETEIHNIVKKELSDELKELNPVMPPAENINKASIETNKILYGVEYTS